MSTNELPAGRTEHSFFDLPEPERSKAIARALGANTVYHVTNQPNILDLLVGNIQVDREHPIVVTPEEEV